MDSQQQTGKAEKVASKLINKLAIAELELANREVEIDELKLQIQQLTQLNQELSNKEQRVKENNK